MPPRNLPGGTAWGGAALRWFCLIGSIAARGLVTLPAMGRDLVGRYKDSALQDWFEHLARGEGLCCSYADGYVIKDADWQTKSGH